MINLLHYLLVKFVRGQIKFVLSLIKCMLRQIKFENAKSNLPIVKLAAQNINANFQDANSNSNKIKFNLKYIK